MKQQDSTKNYPDTVWSKNFNQQNKKMKDLCTCGKDPLLVSMYSIVWRVWYGSCTMLVLSVLWIRNFNDFRIQPDPGKSSRFNRIQEKVPDPTGSGFTTLRTVLYTITGSRCTLERERTRLARATKKPKKIPQLVVDGACRLGRVRFVELWHRYLTNVRFACYSGISCIWTSVHQPACIAGVSWCTSISSYTEQN